jgi:hypothetical protein
MEILERKITVNTRKKQKEQSQMQISLNDSSRFVIRFFSNNSEDTMIVFDKEQTKRLINFIRMLN